MAIDPSLCPIPPGFRVIGDFTDGFDNVTDITNYGSWTDETGNEHSGTIFGVSKRWNDSNITVADIVCGFQFKIGPNRGTRWTEDGQGNVTVLGHVQSGDVGVHFPRRDPETHDRGGYHVSIVWYEGKTTDDGLVTEGSLGKEIPHPVYGDSNYFRTHKFRDQPNPRPTLPQAKDGRWHSFLAVIWNDYYGRRLLPDPTIGLWYSDIPTHNFEDFEFLGMSIDAGDMRPRRQLRKAVGETGRTFGDDITKIEHPLRIRIDDVQSDQIEIRNVYAAHVEYVGIFPPPNPPPTCIAEAKAVNDAQAKIEELKKKREEARKKMIQPGTGFGGREFNIWRNILENISNIEIPIAIGNLRTAQFNYGECAGVGFRRKKPIDVIIDDVVGLDCASFAKAVDDAQSVVSLLKKRVEHLMFKLQNPAIFSVERNMILKEIQDIQNNQLPPAKDKLATAKNALDNCKKNLPSDIGSA